MREVKQPVLFALLTLAAFGALAAGAVALW